MKHTASLTFTEAAFTLSPAVAAIYSIQRSPTKLRLEIIFKIS